MPDWLDTGLKLFGGALTLATGQYILKRWRGIPAPKPPGAWTADERAAEQLRKEMRDEEDRAARAKDP